jgi:hypothetical protein
MLKRCIDSMLPVICALQATTEQALKRASLLSDMHLRNLRQKLQLKQKMNEIASKLEVTFQSISQSQSLNSQKKFNKSCTDCLNSIRDLHHITKRTVGIYSRPKFDKMRWPVSWAYL